MYEQVADQDETQEQPKQHPAMLLQSFIGVVNIVTLLTQEEVDKIGKEVTRGFDVDIASRSEWEKEMKIAMDLAMQAKTPKTWPWPKAANVKYPLITTAAIQFSARAYPAIVAGADVVKGEVLGPDDGGQKKERAERIGRHMSYQILNEIEDWDEEADKLLLQMSIIGCAFRKTYFDSMLGRPCSDLISAKDLVFDHATPWKKLRRMTHQINLYKNDVTERVRGGIFVDIELGTPLDVESDEDAAFEFLECHCWYDLDKDGYKEPYIVTVKKDNSKVVRIFPRFDEEGILLNAKQEITKIKPVEYFTKFSFMPNPDGGSYDVGLGMLLNPINETVNSVMNQLLDAGTLANTGGGFLGAGLKMKGGAVKFAPGEFKPVDSSGRISDNIYHMQFPGPSPVLFQLLGMLIEAGKGISSVQDIMTGEQRANQTATTTLALIEQGQKVFSAIYKRVHRGLASEFKKLFRLNKLYLKPEDYYRYMDKQETIYLQDYQGDDTDVSPISDPSLVSDGQIMARAEALMKFANDPLINQVEIRKNYLKAIKVQNPEKYIIEGQPALPPEVQQAMQQAQEHIQQQDQQIQQMVQELQQNQHEGHKLQADAQKAQQDAQLAGQKLQLEAQKVQQDAQIAEAKLQLDAQKIQIDQFKAETDRATAECGMNPVDNGIEIQKLELERFKAQLAAETSVLIKQMEIASKESDAALQGNQDSGALTAALQGFQLALEQMRAPRTATMSNGKQIRIE